MMSLMVDENGVTFKEIEKEILIWSVKREESSQEKSLKGMTSTFIQ